MSAIIRAYKYRAFPPRSGDADLATAIDLKRAFWKRLIAIEDDYNARKSALLKSDEFGRRRAALAVENKSALAELRAAQKSHLETVKPELLGLGSWRVDRQRDAKQAAAAAGLHWGDYNAAMFQFEGARAAAKARGAHVYNFETACGEALVNQVMNGRRPADMCSFGQCRLSFRPDKNAGARKPKSHRAGYRAAAIDMTIRGPRNPQGAARLTIEFVMHRPLPPNAMVKEVRAIRTWRKVINRDGQCFSRADWAVVFVLAIDVAPRADRACAGISLTWRGDAAEDGLQPYAVLFDGAATKTLTMDYGYEADWDHSADLAARAERSGDASDVIAAEAFLRRLGRRRQAAQRAAAAGIARRYACVAVQKLDLSGKGSKRNVAPASFRLALRHALEARGGVLVEVDAALNKVATNPHRALAKKLHEAARAHLAGAKKPALQDQIAESVAEVAA